MLKPFRFHGLDMTWIEGRNEARADCPWGGCEGKFSINVETGQWRCFVCNQGKDSGKAARGGNVQTFLQMLWEKSYREADDRYYHALAGNRRLMDPATLYEWGVRLNPLNNKWIIPGFTT